MSERGCHESKFWLAESVRRCKIEIGRFITNARRNNAYIRGCSTNSLKSVKYLKSKT